MDLDTKIRKLFGTEKSYCIDCGIRIRDDDKPMEFKEGWRCQICGKKYQEKAQR
jgi:tRNA(Ile2) C34 agmatinyltransferase TiaS